jgi:hypothetical protein
METCIGRRRFVGTVVAGAPLLTVVARQTTAQTASAIAAGHAHPAPDPVLDHITRQLAAAHNAMRRDARGEPLRALAAELRTLAVYSRHVDLDARVASSIGALIDEQGPDALMNFQPDRSRLRTELEHYGAVADDRILNAALDLSPDRRTAVLERIRRSGLSTSWEQLAELSEHLAVDLDRRSSSVVRVNRVQDAAYWEGYCTELWNQFSEAQFIAGMICAVAGIPIIGVAVVPLCIAHELGALTLGYVYAAYCLNR